MLICLTCYKKYSIYDNVQYSILYKEQLLGVLTLFRTKADGVFNSDDMFYLRALGQHINMVMHRLCSTPEATTGTGDISELTKKYGLTAREEEIIGMIFGYMNNNEIADALSVSENTVQKHLQNIFRKTDTSSKWELLKIRGA